MARRWLWLVGLCVVLASVGCESGGNDGDPAGPGVTDDTKPESDGKETAKADEWNYANDPARFRVAYEYNYETLSGYSEGEAEQLPWPSDYWAYYEDSTNVRYHGDDVLSPVEKYDQAFNGWTPNMDLKPLDVSADCEGGTFKDRHEDYYTHLGPAARYQSENKGNGRMRDGIDNDNDGETDECGGDDYDGIETWWGLCHAWTPAAILEPEPLHPVTYNGVEFSVSDIKGLLITMYDHHSAAMLGSRCDEKEVTRDDLGRVEEAQCRDTNAGSWHVVAVNMLAMQKRAFAMDRTFDYQVWNQPVLGFKIREQRKVSEQEALQLLGHEAGTKYTEVYNSPNAVSWVYVDMDMKYISEAANYVEDALTIDRARYDRYVHTDHYKYVLELDANGDIVGGEWLDYSQRLHPDFLWLPVSGTTGGNPHVSMGNVRMLLDLSRKTDEPGDPNLTIKTYGGEELNIDIPDNDAVGIARRLEVGDDITIGSLKVDVEIRHTYIGDLKVTVSHEGKIAVLHDRTGGSQSDLIRSFDVADFDGMTAAGDWEIAVSDHAGQDVGKLVRWSLTVGTADTVILDGVLEANAGLSSPLAIPDNDENGVSSTISVTAEGTITKIEVTVDITHTYIGDLKVGLMHDGNTQILHSREGGSADDIRKTYPIDGFIGAPVKGDWTLVVTDHAGRDVGTLNAWSLKATLSEATGGEDIDPTEARPILLINEILANPAGSDSGHEFVELVNAGTGAADLSGYTLGDGWSRNRHVFPAGTTLAPGAAMVIFDKGDHGGIPHAVVTSSGRLGLNNSGDTVSIYDTEGQVVETFAYRTQKSGVSINRQPDGDPAGEMIRHTDIDGASGSMSPGTRADGTDW